MSAHQPTVMSFGPALVISPDGSHDVPANLWADFATMVLLSPEPPLLATWVKRLEDDLGVNEAHRRAVESSPDAVKAEIRSYQEGRGLRAPDTGRVELPDDERGRGEYDLSQLDLINARLSRNAYRPKGGKTAAEQREADLKAREMIEAQPGLKADGKRVREGIVETEALAHARGEQVEDTGGVKRILDHDPIASLKWLSDEQAAAAALLRECYELRAVDAGAMEYTGMPSGGHDHERFVANRFARAKATLLIGQMTNAILVGHFRSSRGSLIEVRAHARFAREGVSTHDALNAIRAVCGDGKTLTSLGAGRAYERNRRALALGLDMTHEVLHG